MLIPATIKIGPTPYEVNVRAEVELDGQPHYGAFYPREHRIDIWSGLPPERQLVTLIHEAIHAIEEDRQLDLPEHVVDALAKGIGGLLLDNDLIRKD